MSKEVLKSAFEAAKACDAWSLQLIKIQSKKDNVDYYCREIKLEPEGRIKQFVEELSNRYLQASGVDSYVNIDDYTGDVVGNVIYKLQSDDQLISTEFTQLVNRISNPDIEDKIDIQKFHAYVLSGTVMIEGEMAPLKLFSMQSPLVSMTNRFLMIDKKNFREITDRVLSLRKTIDVVILGKDVYMFTLSGEKLFAMERAYKTICNTKVDEIMSCGILSNPEAFKIIAKSGHNPRRFVSYNPDRLTAMSDARKRKKLAAKFGIALDANNKIDTDDEKTPERLVKFLCNKGMLDPLDESPVEVSAAKNWQ